MAFTIEELTKYSEQNSENTFFANSVLRSNPNYNIVIDYLTGKTKSLSSLMQTHENMSFQSIIYLLKSIDPPSINDQLILNVATHPDIYPYVSYFFIHRIISFAAIDDTDSGIASAERILKSIGFSNDEIFHLFIFSLEYSYYGIQPPEVIGQRLKTYLLSILPSKASYLPFSSGIMHVANRWSKLYFELLEEGKPELLKDYLTAGLLERNNNVSNFIHEYKNGQYIPLVVDWLKARSGTNEELEKKFETAVQLYEKNNELFKEIATDLSKKYLHYYQMNKPDESWSRQLYLNFFNANNASHIRYSAAAIHFAIIDDAKTAKDTVRQWFDKKLAVSFDVLQVLYHHFASSAIEYLRLGLKADASLGGIQTYRKILRLLIDKFEKTDYLETVWELTQTKSKPLREEIAKLLAEEDTDAEPKAIKLLQSKNAEARQTAALILSLINSKEAVSAVKSILNTEANDNARDILLQIAATSLPAKAERSFVKEMIQAAANRKKLSKPIESWLDEDVLPVLYFKDGEKLGQDEIRFLFYRMFRAKGMRSDIEAKYLIGLIDKNHSANFAKQIIQLFIDRGAKPELKFTMTVAAMLGNDEIVDKLKTVINGWIEVNRTKMAEYGIGALALQGSNKALRLVEYYSRKYKNKTASVGIAAAQALEDAAEELGISAHELGDRIVPDFGFDDLFKPFTINGEEYRAFIDSNFKLAFFNEDNKKLKSLPSTASKELKDEFKNIVKEVRDVVKSQSLRLEHYLVTQRRWNSEEWQKFYLTNPVMFIYATKLLWGKYDKDGNLIECFLCLDDTSLINIEDDEISLDEDVLIGIVHPIHLDAQTVQGWKQKLFDLSIEPILPQLKRNTAFVDVADTNKTINYAFDGIETEPGSIKTTLEKWGWRKGQTGNGGYLDHFIYENKTAGINAVIEVEGVFVGGYGYDSEPKLGRLFFIDKKKETTKWFMFPKDEKDEKLIRLGAVDEIFYSEVAGSLLAIKQKMVAA